MKVKELIEELEILNPEKTVSCAIVPDNNILEPMKINISKLNIVRVDISSGEIILILKSNGD